MLNREGGGLINFPPLKRGSLLERGGGLNRGLAVICFVKNYEAMFSTERLKISKCT